MNGRVVLVGKKTEFRGVALRKEVLNVNVSNLYLLLARLEGVETAVGVLLQHVEVGQVVVDAVRTQVPEDSHSRLFIREDEAAKVAVELLNAGSDRHEVKVRTKIVEFQFEEPFLQAHMRVEPVGACFDVDVDYAAFLGLEEVQIDRWGETEPEINRLEGSVAAKQIEGEQKGLATKASSSFPKNCSLFGCSDPRPLGIGKRRRSKPVMLVPVNLRNQS